MRRLLVPGLVLLMLMLFASGSASGQADLELLRVSPPADDGSQTWSLSLQVLVLMTVLTLLPSLLLMFTSFTRIIVVLAILRQALGTGTTPSNQVLIGLALFLTLFVMTPVAMEVNEVAIGPYMNEEMTMNEALEQGFEPIHRFMRYQVRESDLLMFAEIGGIEAAIEEPADIPLRILIPAFITSELKTAFQIGFLIFIPFLIIDLAVASVLMSMGMMMLSPMLVSLPFKLMLFVLVDGWSLVAETLVSSFFAGG